MTPDVSDYGVPGMPEELIFDSILTGGKTSDFASFATALDSFAEADSSDQTYFSQYRNSSTNKDRPVSGFDRCQIHRDRWCTALDEGIDLSPMPPAGKDLFKSFLSPSSDDTIPWLDSYADVSEFGISDSGSGVLPHMASDLSECPTQTSPPINPHLSRPTAAPNNSFHSDNQRWHATQSRSRAADSAFLYGVLTTRIFCRPSCASRRASRRNVRFFSFPGAVEAAEGAGFRPCKRCIPNAPGVKNTAVLGVCEVLRLVIAETFGRPTAGGQADMKLESLARSAGLSTFHFHRMFKATTQITPGDFLRACRSLALQDTLGMDQAQNSNIDSDSAALVEGSPYWSLRSARKALGGITPPEYAKGASTLKIQYCSIETPPGTMCVICSPGKGDGDTRLHAVLLGDDAEARAHIRFPRAKASFQNADSVTICIRELEEESRDRDTELNTEILLVLWRARVWLKLTQHYRE